MILEGVSPSVFHLGKTGRSQKLLWKGEAAFEADVPASVTFTLSDSTFFLAWVTMSSRKCWSWNCRHLPMRWKMKGDANGTPQVFQVVMAKRGISPESITMARAKQMEEARSGETRQSRRKRPANPLKLERNAFYYDTKRAHSGLADHADLEYPGIILKSSHQRFMFGPVLPACCFGWLAQESAIKHSYIWYSTFTSSKKRKMRSIRAHFYCAWGNICRKTNLVWSIRLTKTMQYHATIEIL